MTNNQADGQQTGTEFGIQRIYVKDISFEAPNAPEIFRHEWKPEMDVDLNTTSQKLEDGVYEVVLKVTVTAKNAENTAFLTEVHQAGIFTIQHFSEEQLDAVLNSFCPNILFPYIRETIANLVDRGSFPSLHLSPINFDALYAQHLERKKEEAQQQETAGKSETDTTTH